MPAPTVSTVAGPTGITTGAAAVVVTPNVPAVESVFVSTDEDMRKIPETECEDQFVG
jgi:hypothetical protein